MSQSLLSLETEEDPQKIKEVIIAVAGKSGAGKMSLANKILGRKIEIKISPDPTTEKCEILLDINEGIRLTIIDNPGLMTGKEKKRIQELLCLCSRRQFFLHLLLYCVPVAPTAKFKDCNPQIMKSLQSKFGKGIWKNCIIAFTFANQDVAQLKSIKNILEHMPGSLKKNCKRISKLRT